MRSFALPDNLDQQGIRAETKDGVLTVHLPKVRVHWPVASGEFPAGTGVLGVELLVSASCCTPQQSCDHWRRVLPLATAAAGKVAQPPGLHASRRGAARIPAAGSCANRPGFQHQYPIRAGNGFRPVSDDDAC